VLSLLLVHDLLLAKGGIALPQSHGLRQSVERHKARLTSELTRARLRRKAPTIQDLQAEIDRASAGEEALCPRWVRVNALQSSIEEQLETTFSSYTRTNALSTVVTAKAKHVYIDPHVPGLLGVTQGTELTKTEAYSSGKIILQDKASCFPAYLLDPRSEDGDVVDACAAPGNKTTHLAAILHEHQPEFESAPQTIYAFEKDARRAQTLEKMVKVAGSRKMTRIGLGQDFLRVDPQGERYRAVGALLLDPSCSGSGIVGRDSMPEVHLPEVPSAKGKRVASTQGAQGDGKKRKHEGEPAAETVLMDDDGNETVVRSRKDLQARLDALAAFQLSLLLHAFHFPAARKITYSTCSVHAEENEHVVIQALQSKVARERGWRILKREDQVRGMREWPVRGLAEACEGDTDVAEGCIRSYKGDGQGVMGFFVAGLVRSGAEDDEDADVDGDGPYLRDDGGIILRDVLGMPVLKSTGTSVTLEPRDGSGAAKADANADSDDESAQSDSSDEGTSNASEEEEESDEWDGFGD
jgi:25S rRNA (cytosine2278-C5)-methyltransferase